jgi:hypothetical protein
METLRESRVPLSVRQIVKGVMERRKLATDDGALVASIQNRVGAALRTAKARGTLVSERGEGPALVWRTAS